ncbi:hypothetical protein [Phormidesmis priestleyi]
MSFDAKPFREVTDASEGIAEGNAIETRTFEVTDEIFLLFSIWDTMKITSAQES